MLTLACPPLKQLFFPNPGKVRRDEFTSQNMSGGPRFYTHSKPFQTFEPNRRKQMCGMQAIAQLNDLDALRILVLNFSLQTTIT